MFCALLLLTLYLSVAARPQWLAVAANWASKTRRLTGDWLGWNVMRQDAAHCHLSPPLAHFRGAPATYLRPLATCRQPFLPMVRGPQG